MGGDKKRGRGREQCRQVAVNSERIGGVWDGVSIIDDR